MRTLSIATLLTITVLPLVVGAQDRPVATVPRLVRINNTFRPANGQPAAPLESVTLSIYGNEHDVDPLWSETQNVDVDAEGRYSVLMGSSIPEGVPADLFRVTEPRWLGVRFNRPGEPEARRSLLVSVPYALKAADADTLGGRPASEYLLSPSAASAAATGAKTSASDPDVAAVSGKMTPKANAGTSGYVARFLNSSDLGNSAMYQSGGNIGIGTTTPGTRLDIQTNATGYGSSVNIQGTVDPVSGATRVRVLNPRSSLLLNAYGSGSPGLLANAAGLAAEAPSSSFVIATDNVPFYVFTNNSSWTAPSLTVLGSGNVGIGTTTPGAKLDVAGNINLSGNLWWQGAPVLRLASGAAGGNLALGPSTLSVNTTGINNTALGHEAMRFNTSGGANTAVGWTALWSNTSGYSNTVTGRSAMHNNTSGSANTANGDSALGSNTTGTQNTAVGNAALGLNTSASFNTAVGSNALYNNISGTMNTAIGGSALVVNSTASGNTAVGASSLQNNTGGWNTAVGDGALSNNTTPTYGTAVGAFALAQNTTGINNTAVGGQAMFMNTIGYGNTAVGTSSLNSNSNGNNNTGLGSSALQSNTTGYNNTAAGNSALYLNQAGYSNTAIGYSALANNTVGVQNVAVGEQALHANSGGTNNIAIGYRSASSVGGLNSNNIHISSVGAMDDSGAIRIGTSGLQTSFIAAGIRGVTTGMDDALPVVIDSTGQLGTVSSSRRYKENIQNMGRSSMGLMQLRPVTFAYRQPFADGSKPIQYGLIAEEVAAVYPELVAHSADGQIESVKYQVLNAMLLNEVQRQQNEIQSLEEQLRQQNERLNRLEALLSATSAESGGRR